MMGQSNVRFAIYYIVYNDEDLSTRNKDGYLIPLCSFPLYR